MVVRLPTNRAIGRSNDEATEMSTLRRLQLPVRTLPGQPWKGERVCGWGVGPVGVGSVISMANYLAISSALTDDLNRSFRLIFTSFAQARSSNYAAFRAQRCPGTCGIGYHRGRWAFACLPLINSLPNHVDRPPPVCRGPRWLKSLCCVVTIMFATRTNSCGDGNRKGHKGDGGDHAAQKNDQQDLSHR
jgi:hypothetical protein